MIRKQLILKEIRVLSNAEKAAKMVAFHPKLNLITGENDVGKSSIIKSIYHTLGAEVHFDDIWNKANVITLLVFSFNDVEYKMLRARSNFGLFDSDNNLIRAFESVVKELSPFLADLFGNNLNLKNANSRIRVPATPAVQFLASYIDQDKGWTGPWQSFEGLGMFPGYKQDLIEFYVGIRPNEWYILTEKIDLISVKLTELANEAFTLKQARKTVAKHMPKTTFNIDLKAFRKEINLLLLHLTGLRIKEDEYRRKLLKQKNQEAYVDNEISVVRSSIKEITKDYDYSLKKLEEEITCPTCFATYENSMVSRFGLLDDAESCRNFLAEYLEDKKSIAKTISGLETNLSLQRNKIAVINKIMDEKKGKVRLGDLLKNESAKQVNQVFQESEESYSKQILYLENESVNHKASRSQLNNKQRKAEITSRFKTLIDTFFIKLNVQTLSAAGFSKIPVTVKSQGSDTPRALLAYYYAILLTSQEFTDLPLFPLIIDSPNQQDQDESNRKKIIEFIFKNTPSDYQLILGTVDLHGVEYKGHTIKPTESLSVLNKGEYDETYRIVTPLLDSLHEALISEDESEVVTVGI